MHNELIIIKNRLFIFEYLCPLARGSWVNNLPMSTDIICRSSAIFDDVICWLMPLSHHWWPMIFPESYHHNIQISYIHVNIHIWCQYEPDDSTPTCKDFMQKSPQSEISVLRFIPNRCPERIDLERLFSIRKIYLPVTIWSVTLLFSKLFLSAKYQYMYNWLIV